MPNVDYKNGYRFYFYSHEPNEPSHVHVDKNGNSAKFCLQNMDLARNYGFSPKELGEILRIIRENRDKYLEAWNGYFGASGR